MNKLLKIFLASAFTAVSLTSVAAPSVLDLKHSITDPAIVYPESYETDTQQLLEGWFIKNYTATDTRYATEPDVVISDKEAIKRLGELPTVIEMPYNQIVRSYIDKYTRDSRPQIAAILGMSLYYMPIFEQALEEQGLPLELKYLPVIESGLDPNAVSSHGATGLWQFILAAAKGLGMEVNSLVDERRDPYLSSEMAASYLKSLYESYGDWSLAIAAYNCGPGTVNKALRRAGGDSQSHDFWSIYNYLPAETRGYVPMFIAINYVMTYYPEHNISPVLPVKPLVIDTIHINERIHFNQICAVLDIPIEELRILNPQFRADIIPGTPESTYNLILPSQQIHAYLMSENDIRNFEAEKYAKRQTVDPGEMPADGLLAVEEMEIWGDEPVASNNVSSSGSKKTLVIHKVASGETLETIAALYETTPAEIKKSNNLRRNAVRVGQQLRVSTGVDNPLAQNAVPVVPSTNKPAAQPAVTTQKKQKETTVAQQNSKKKAATTKKKEPAKPVSYTVKSGDNLTKIANQYGVTVNDLKKANNLSGDAIKPGQTLKMPSKNTTKKTKKTKSSTTTTKKTTTKKKKK